MIAGVLLAAGRSTRFGNDKLVALLAGRPVMSYAAASLAAVVDELYVVMPPGSSGRASALADVRHRVVINEVVHGGMASSIAAGIAALPAAAEAAVVALGDQPLVSVDVVRALLVAWRSSGALVVAPRYRDGRGHPVLFSRDCFQRLRALEGDRGAAPLLASFGSELVLVSVDEDAPLDVDTPEILDALARRQPRPDS